MVNDTLNPSGTKLSDLDIESLFKHGKAAIKWTNFNLASAFPGGVYQIQVGSLLVARAPADTRGFHCNVVFGATGHSARPWLNYYYIRGSVCFGSKKQDSCWFRPRAEDVVLSRVGVTEWLTFVESIDLAITLPNKDLPLQNKISRPEL